jgi:hypothetical protein
MIEARINNRLRVGGKNLYVFLLDDMRGHHPLKCVAFIEREDLSDQIFCNEEGEEMRVAKYHAHGTLSDEAETLWVK